MRILPLLAAALALAAPTAVLAGTEEVSGYYDGKAACDDGETQLTLIIEVDDDNGVTGSLTINPFKRPDAKAATRDYRVSGTFTGATDLDLTPGDWTKHPAGAKALGFRGSWFEADANGDITIIGRLEGGSCKDFVLTRDAMASDM